MYFSFPPAAGNRAHRIDDRRISNVEEFKTDVLLFASFLPQFDDGIRRGKAAGYTCG